MRKCEKGSESMKIQNPLELIGRFELPTSSLPTGIGVFCVVFFRDSSSHGGSNGLNAVGLFVIWAQIIPLYPLLFQPGITGRLHVANALCLSFAGNCDFGDMKCKKNRNTAFPQFWMRQQRRWQASYTRISDRQMKGADKASAYYRPKFKRSPS